MVPDVPKLIAMNNILALVNGPLGKEIINGIGKNAGTSPEETKSVISTALPAILGSMQKNASSAQGAAGLLGALQGKHDGSILDNLGGFFGAGGDEKDGNGILKHVLGGNKSSLESAVSQKTGVSSASVSKILALLAPVVMGYLGKESKSKQVQSGGGIGDFLGGMLGGQGGGAGDLLGGFLDQDGDGKFDAKDVGSLLGGFFKKK